LLGPFWLFGEAVFFAVLLDGDALAADTFDSSQCFLD
jgi:hypothetical protein